MELTQVTFLYFAFIGQAKLGQILFCTLPIYKTPAQIWSGKNSACKDATISHSGENSEFLKDMSLIFEMGSIQVK